MENNGPKRSSLIITYIVMFVFSFGITIGGAYFYKISTSTIIKLITCVAFAGIFIIFSFNAGIANNYLFGNNKEHPIRFYLIYLLMLLLAIGFTMMPIASWPYVAVFAVLVLFSNVPTGIIAGLTCLLISISFGAHPFESYFILYFLSGITIASLLGNLDNDFKIAWPIIISELVLFCGLMVIMFVEDGIGNKEGVLYLLINVAITLILLLISLKAYFSKVIYFKNDPYDEKNDPECKLLSELKNIAPEEYRKSLHVAYFCDRIARRLGLNESLLKCCAYYHRIGTIGGTADWTKTYEICEANEIPKEVIDILSEFWNDKSAISKTETAVLYMSETIVASVLFLFNKDNNMELELNSLIDAIFKQRLGTGMFNNCNISLRQMEEMKKVFIEEKLYYDFLR